MEIKCSSCGLKASKTKWNGSTFIFAKKHKEQPNITNITKAIKNDLNNLKYVCPRCKELVGIEKIKEVNENVD